MNYDDAELHGEDDQEYIEDDATDMNTDDDNDTRTDTDEDDQKETAEDVKNRQKTAWLRNIKEGRKTLEDMPDNLGWLKKEVEKDLEEPKKQKATEDELETRIRKTLQAERDQEDFQALAGVVEEADLEDDKLEELKEMFEDLKSDGVKPLKALRIAMKSAGMKDSQTMLAERRSKGMLLPPRSSKARQVVTKDGMTDMERKFNRDLPNGYAVKK